MLFSEPKISQLTDGRILIHKYVCFSALQRAENFSIRRPHHSFPSSASFSALQRAENFSIFVGQSEDRLMVCFSALQRAENFSMIRHSGRLGRAAKFQCSSASRKFLNPVWEQVRRVLRARFSALQRAENFSIAANLINLANKLEFQCSSASRKFLNSAEQTETPQATAVSVLFSEPKISQFGKTTAERRIRDRFSALQRAENFSIIRARISAQF